MNQPLRICARCKKRKSSEAFYVKLCQRGSPHSYCKSCHNAYTTERFRRRKKQAVEYLGARCADCRGTFPYFVYDFHHRDPAQKDMQFNSLRRRSWEVIQRELDKCVLLCANCHRMRHWERFIATESPIP